MQTKGKNICVITGGSSGIGLAAAKEIGKTHYIIICGRNLSKLEDAILELKFHGVECEAFSCDVSDKDSVRSLVQRAVEIGEIQSLIHSAGMSPQMGNAETIMKINALGTINLNNEFLKVMKHGSCIVNVSSISAYMLPEIILPKRAYAYCFYDEEGFFRKMMSRINLFPKKLRSKVSYAVSKNFVVWFSKKNAVKAGEKGIRSICVSPGNFETPMGNLEKEDAEKYLKNAAIKRFGKPEEIAFLFSSIVDSRNSYLTGVDIVCDGGLISSL